MGSTWKSGTPLDQKTIDLLEGLQITHTEKAYRILTREGDTAVSEVFGDDLVLQPFKVKMSAMTIRLYPSYEPTENGLPVKGFVAHILPAEGSTDSTLEMHVAVDT